MIPTLTRVLILLLAVSVITEGAQGPFEPRFDTEVPPRPKEICVVCNRPIGLHDKVYLLEGQRVAVHPEHCPARLPMRSPLRLITSPRACGFVSVSPSPRES